MSRSFLIKSFNKNKMSLFHFNIKKGDRMKTSALNNSNQEALTLNALKVIQGWEDDDRVLAIKLDKALFTIKKVYIDGDYICLVPHEVCDSHPNLWNGNYDASGRQIKLKLVYKS
jgi:hypothetical protein